MAPSLRLDAAGQDEAAALLRTCCGSTRWVDRMLGRRPFGTRDCLLAAAREEWFTLSHADWREAFAHHPAIGERESLRRRFPSTGHLSEREQAGVATAPDDVIDALARANAEYLQTFGWIFIVCATGRSAEEMLALLRARMANDPETEIRVAAEEQARITELRLVGIENAVTRSP